MIRILFICHGKVVKKRDKVALFVANRGILER